MEDVTVHPKPVWRDRANFIIMGRIDSGGPVSGPSTEQLWARQVDDFQFEICCIPFFLYNLALGDIVATGTLGEDQYLIDSVMKESGRFVFRVWLGESTDPDELSNLLAQAGCLLERQTDTSRLLAIDAATEEIAQRVADILQNRENSGQIHYETGRINKSQP